MNNWAANAQIITVTSAETCTCTCQCEHARALVWIVRERAHEPELVLEPELDVAQIRERARWAYRALLQGRKLETMAPIARVAEAPPRAPMARRRLALRSSARAVRNRRRRPG